MIMDKLIKDLQHSPKVMAALRTVVDGMQNAGNVTAFERLAKELMPNMDRLQGLPIPETTDFHDIADYIFRDRGEFLGGMASVLAAILYEMEKAQR